MMTTAQEVQQKLSNNYVHFYSWTDDKDKDWWIASSFKEGELSSYEGDKQPTPEQALSALIRKMTRE